MDDQLKHLFEYTKFHLGVYTTLIGAIIGIFANDQWREAYSEYVFFILVSVVLFLFAAVFGGLVASSIPYSTTFTSFMERDLGPWSSQKFTISAKTCTHLEHACFWLGSFVAVFGLVLVAVSNAIGTPQ